MDNCPADKAKVFPWRLIFKPHKDVNKLFPDEYPGDPFKWLD